MKKSKLFGIVAIALVAVLVVGAAAAAVFSLGGEPTVTFDYSQKAFRFSNVDSVAGTEIDLVPEDDGHGHEYPNLFQNEMKSLMPGDRATQTIKVTAKNLKGGSAKISLRTDCTLDGITEAEKADYAKLLSSVESVELIVAMGNQTISSGSLEEGVVLGTFQDGDTMELTVTLNIPITAGNELQGLQAAVAWVFTAEYFPRGNGGGGSSGGDDINRPQLNTKEHFAYIIGFNDGLVHPEANISRAEAATIFFRMLTDESREQYWSKSNSYVDVAETAWYNNAVSTLTNAGIITGKPGNRFDPNAPVTRAEFAAMAVRFFGGTYEGEDLFTDIAGHWANKEINLAALKNLVEGLPDGTFQPDRAITRAEAMAIVNRLLSRSPHKDYLLEDMITWPDNMNTKAWYYADVQEATNSHSYTYIVNYTGDGEQYEVWTELLPVRDWAALEKIWSDSNSAGNPGEVISSKDAAVFD